MSQVKSKSKKAYGILKLRDTFVVSEATRKSMQGNQARETKPEVMLRKALWALRARGYRKNVRSLPGAPDIVFTKQKLAIFVHGCYWHCCPRCMRGRIPKTNTSYWTAKLEGNTTRDRRNLGKLHQLGYRTLTFWECDIKMQAARIALDIERARKHATRQKSVGG